MRNLKRALSLVMAAAMLVSVLVISTGAASIEDFPDKDDITNQTAVSTLVNLNVIAGRDTGVFDPSATVTRAEMAKMIAIIKCGGSDSVSETPTTYTFTDTEGHWAAGYIEYCANNGIIGGRGDGRFDPDSDVTGSEAAKMLLTTLGYDAAVFGFTGAQWEGMVNARAYAKDADLYNGLSSLTPSLAISRDNVSQMIYNALDAYIMEPSYEYDSNGVNYKYALGTTTLLENAYKAVKVTGVVTNNEYISGSGMDGKTTLTNVEENNAGLSDGNYKFSSDGSVLGMKVSVYAVPSNSSTSSEKATIVGEMILNDDDNTVFETGNGYDKWDDLKKDLNSAGLKFNSTSNLLQNVSSDVYSESVILYWNYDEKSFDYSDANLSTSTLTDLTGAGIVCKFIDNTDDGKIDVVLFTAPAFGKVTTYSTSGDGKVTISKVGRFGLDSTLELDSSDNVVLNEGSDNLSTTDAYTDIGDFDNVDIAKNDYAFYIDIGDVTQVTPAEVLTSTITSRRTDKITVDGTTYEISALANTSKVTSKGDADFSNVSVNKDATLYLDTYNNIVYLDADKTSDDYLYARSSNVTDLDTTGNYFEALKVRVVFSDGSYGTIEIENFNGDSIEDIVENQISGYDVYNLQADLISAADGAVYTYSENDNGTYDIDTVDAGDQGFATGASVTKGKASPSGTGFVSGVSMDSDTVFVVGSSSTSYKVYTGVSNVSSFTGADVAYVYDDDNVIEVMFAMNSTSDDDSYLVILGDGAQTVISGTKVYEYSAYYNGTIYDIDGDGGVYVDNSSNNAISNNTGLYLNVGGDASKITGVSSSSTRYFAPAEVSSVTSSVLTTLTRAGNSTDSGTEILTYTLDDSTEFITVESDGDISEGGSSDDIDPSTDTVIVIAQSTESSGRFTAATVIIFEDTI
ncbi:MAG: S-layer homology domain-containing protein [Oscillospiraceae bacterium]|nr:S-layer homology domain-containing protein [Oscillospiraceae bacterium]